jgi:hypothetical protein
MGTTSLMSMNVEAKEISTMPAPNPATVEKAEASRPISGNQRYSNQGLLLGIRRGQNLTQARGRFQPLPLGEAVR